MIFVTETVHAAIFLRLSMNDDHLSVYQLIMYSMSQRQFQVIIW